MPTTATNYFRTHPQGGVVRTIEYRGHTIEKVIVGYAYAKNGNAHNPTPRVKWLVDREPSSSLREAKQYIDLILALS